VRRGEKPRAVCSIHSPATCGGPARTLPGSRWCGDWWPTKMSAVFEVSTLNDHKEGNAIHVASLADGRILWSRAFVPSMNHMKQARAMFVGDTLWILEHLQCVGLDVHSGQVKHKYPGRPLPIAFPL